MKLQVFIILVLAGLTASQLSSWGMFPWGFPARPPTRPNLTPWIPLPVRPNNPNNPNQRSICRMDINLDMPQTQPLFIQPGTTNFFHPSTRQGIFVLLPGQEMDLVCPGGFSSPSTAYGESIRVECFGGVQFTYNGLTVNFNQYNCKNWPTPVARRRSSSGKCYGTGDLVDIGFELGSNFYHVFTSCHDSDKERNLYTEYRLTPVSDGQQRNVDRTSWRQEDFYPGKNMDTLYGRNSQINSIANILGSSSLAKDIIEDYGDVYLVRGHLAAKTDFVTANEQRSTFFFINAEPQFQTFNTANWFAIELSSRKLAADRNLNLDVYTGILGIMTARDGTGVYRNLMLDPAYNQVPVPEYFYKILIDRASKSGVVFIGVNNIHLTLAEILRDHIFCRDVSSQIGYVNWNPTGDKKGYSYACTVADFLGGVSPIPGLSVGDATRLLV